MHHLAPFVGRDRELASLRAALANAGAGRGRLILLVGDAGIGKTSLAEHLCAEGLERGYASLWGRCWEGGGTPAYFPWIEILRAYRRQARSPELGAELSRLLGETSPASSLGVPPESEQMRFRLFDSFADFMKRLTARQPALVVLDDLHWADADSLLLLCFLARELPHLPLLVIGTYRPLEVRLDTTLARLLGDLAADSQRIFVGGLSPDEVRRFVEQLWQGPVGQELVDSVHRVTEGNPFFVDEVVRLMVAQGDPDSPSSIRIPQELSDAIRRRLAPLSPIATEALERAAVIGPHFDTVVLAAIVDVDEPQLSLALEELERAGAIRRLEEPGHYRFTHTLVHQTLYDAIGPPRRMSLHREVAATLERDRGQRAAEIAHHFLACVPARSDPAQRAEDVRRAVEYARRAADEAVRQLAFEQAASYLERALHALDHLRPGTASDAAAEWKCEILLALGDAQRRAGELGRARVTFRDATRLARPLAGTHSLFARAALGVGAASAETGAMDDELIRLLEEALAQVGPRDSALRAGLLSRLARALYFTPSLTRRLELSRQAVEIARRLEDAEATAAALLARHFALWAPGHVHERLEIARELIRLAQARGDTELELEARIWCVADLLETGHSDALGLEIDGYNTMAERARLPRYRWLGSLMSTMRALVREPLASVEAQVAATLALGKRSQIANAEQFFFVQLFNLRQAQGRGAELRDEIVGLLERFPALKVWRSALALIETESGNLASAERELTQLGQQDFVALPRDGNWLPAMVRLADVCAAVGDRHRGEILYRLLQPYADCHAVIATGVALLGSVAHSLGVLAHLLERWDEAAEWFDRAMAMHERIGAPALAAMTQHRHSRLLRERPQPQVQRADQLDAAARVTAQTLGLEALLGDIDDDQHGVDLVVGLQTSVADVAEVLSPAIFRIEGELWHLRFAEVTVRLRDTKGLRILHQLLSHPGERLAVAQLAAAAASGDEGGEGTSTEQLRVNVTRAVAAALRRIAADHPALAKFLSGSIKTGQRCVYQPPGEAAPDWALE